MPQALATTPLGTPDPLDILYPDDLEPSAAEVELGRVLFFDPRLSANRNVSCATCHNPDLGFGDGRRLSSGTDGQALSRHTPSLYNLAWGVLFFLDGRAASLEEQALMPISSAQEMNMQAEELLPRLQSVAWYRAQFERVYGPGPLRLAWIGRAIAAFERSIQVTDTPFDRFLAGDRSALGPAAQRGLILFEGKAECALCHDGPNFTDDSFHNLGHADQSDAGRGGVLGDETLHGAFRTPGLRNVALSAPYMHDGSLATLEEVIRFYNRGGDRSDLRSSLIRPLHLTEGEITDLLAFLGALTQPLDTTRPEIPE